MTAPALKTLHFSLGELCGLYYAVVFNERPENHRWERTGVGCTCAFPGLLS